jgi:hypothetical protein
MNFIVHYKVQSYIIYYHIFIQIKNMNINLIFQRNDCQLIYIYNQK